MGDPASTPINRGCQLRSIGDWVEIDEAIATKGADMSDMTSIQFDNGAIKMAGNLYFPDGFDDGGSYPAIVCVHPGGGVKEQTAGLYAEKLAEHGFITLAFDASHQGASGGEPHFLDDPMRRVGDIYSAVDYLTSLAFIDADRIGALGICAGSGAAIKASSTERRIKAVGTVSAVDVGAATRKGWDGTASESDQIANLEAVAQAAHGRSRRRRAGLLAVRPSCWGHHRTPGSSGGRRLLSDAPRPASERSEQDADDQSQLHGVVHRVRSSRDVPDPTAPRHRRQRSRLPMAQPGALRQGARA